MGRECELDELRTTFAEACSRRGQLILISGEPGIGKTRLSAELAEHASAEGARVAWGRTWEGEGAPAYWPWVQVIRSLSDGFPGEVSVSEAAAAHASMVPSGADELVLPSPPSGSVESEHARFRVFDSVTTFLKRTAEARPLVIILDDLHWADRSSLLLLEFVAHQLRDSRILAIGTYRDGAVRADGSVSHAVGGLSREARNVSLRGLSEPEVSLLMEESGGRRPGARLVSAVHQTSGGNPFFVREIVRALTAEELAEELVPNRLPIPASIRTAIRRRIGSLNETCRALLSMAAVIGREFDVGILERALGRGRSEVFEALAPATDAGLLIRLPERIGAYAFVHAVIRETLYDDIPPSGRARLHRSIGDAIENRHAADLDPHVAELAYHFVEAAAEGDPRKAVLYSERAGRRALAVHAYEEAANHFGRALETAVAPTLDAAVRCRILLGLGAARNGSSDRERAGKTFYEAAVLARAVGDSEAFGQAVLGLESAQYVAWKENRSLASFFEEALERLDPADSALRVALLARLGHGLLWLQDRGRSETLCREAVEMARRLSDPVSLAEALNAKRFASWKAGGAAERLAETAESMRAARDAGRLDLELQAQLFRVADHLELGNIEAFRDEIDAFQRTAEKLRQPWFELYGVVWRAMRALLEGRFEEASTFAQEALTTGQRVQNPNARLNFGIQLFQLHRDLGTLGFLEGPVRAMAAEYPTVVSWQTALALIHAELGKEDEGRETLRRLAADDFAAVPQDTNFVVSGSLLAEAAYLLHDAATAKALYDLLSPLGSINTVVGPATAFLGSMSYFLALLAATSGRWSESFPHFERALETHTRLGARPCLARTRIRYAEALLDSNDTGRVRTAEALLDEGLAVARELAMQRLVDDATRLKARISTVRAASGIEQSSRESRPARGSGGPNRFHHDRKHWVIAYEGVVFRLKDGKGLRALSHLLRHPGREFHAMDLAALAERTSKTDVARPEVGELVSQGLRAGRLGDAGALLDVRAKATYRARLKELEEELEEATRFNDPGRAEAARREMDFLGEELSRAVGLGGRNRKAAAVTERARLNVTRAIRSALGKIAEFSPALHAHLLTAVHTGTYCSYRPEPAAAVTWVLDAE